MMMLQFVWKKRVTENFCLLKHNHTHRHTVKKNLSILWKKRAHSCFSIRKSDQRIAREWAFWVLLFFSREIEWLETVLEKVNFVHACRFDFVHFQTNLIYVLLYHTHASKNTHTRNYFPLKKKLKSKSFGTTHKVCVFLEI